MTETKLSRDERWKIAGQQQQFYNQNYGTNISKSAFYKDENPLTNKLVRFDVTIYDLKHSGNSKKLGGSYEFFMPQQTYSIYVLDDGESQAIIEERTKAQISDLFKGGSKSWVYDRLEVEAIRGIEKSNVEYKDIDVNSIHTQESSKTIPINIDVESTRGNSTKKYPYKLDLWI